MNWSKRIEIAANLAILVVACLICTTFVSARLRSQNHSFHENPLPGERLSIQGVNWGTHTHTLVLALSTSCHFCLDSSTFYARLSRVRSKTVGLVAVLPQDNQETSRYLSDHGIEVDEARQSQLTEIHASGTPTLMLVDQNGNILKTWVGKLPESKEQEVLLSIRG